MTLLSTDEVLALLRVSRAYLRQLMLQTPEHIACPWAAYGRGTGTRTRYRWEPPEASTRTSIGGARRDARSPAIHADVFDFDKKVAESR